MREESYQKLMIWGSGSTIAKFRREITIEKCRMTAILPSRWVEIRDKLESSTHTITILGLREHCQTKMILPTYTIRCSARRTMVWRNILRCHSSAHTLFRLWLGMVKLTQAVIYLKEKSIWGILVFSQMSPGRKMMNSRNINIEIGLKK